jgi:ketosteroid isomerase-like protein
MQSSRSGSASPRSKRRRGAVALVVLASLVLAWTASTSVAVAGAATSSAATKLKDPEATARKLVTAWLTALKEKDAAEIAASLAPNFQIERADGTGTDRAGYIAKPAVVDTFTLGDDFTAIQSGDTLTVRWSVKVSEQIGDNQFRDVEAPRLTTFVWHKGRWKILSYANFNPPPTQ